MIEARLGAGRLATIAGLSALTVGIGLGGSGRLTYHEAFVAQAAREMIASGSILVPTIDGRPWLEKPPLASWLVALAGTMAGEVTEAVARAPSAVAAAFLAIGLATFAARRFGPDVGWLAGLVQASTFWFVVRGRLAEADILLACLVTWTLVAFDRLRGDDPGPRSQDPARGPGAILPPPPLWRWAFFGALGATALVKGVGFGAVLVASAVLAVVAWDRDRAAIRALLDPRGWALAGLLALTWPALVAWRLPSAVSLWALHVTDRLATRPEHFIGGGPWWQYGATNLGQALPWTPLALMGAWPSLTRAVGRKGRGGGDRLLWAWAVAPVVVLSMATVKNAHYAIHALPPFAAWAALGLARVGARLVARGVPPARVRLGAWALFGALGLGCGLGHLGLGPRFDRRGGEWAWTARVGRDLDPGLPLAFLYEDWDRKPYPTPFGPVPHDWAVRLFYLGRPATWRQGVDDLDRRPPAPSPAPYALFGRARDLPALRQLGRVETLIPGPADRFDREFTVFRITPATGPTAEGPRVGRAPDRRRRQ